MTPEHLAIVAALAAIPVAILTFVGWAFWSLTHWGQTFTGPDEQHTSRRGDAR